MVMSQVLPFELLASDSAHTANHVPLSGSLMTFVEERIVDKEGAEVCVMMQCPGPAAALSPPHHMPKPRDIAPLHTLT